MLLFCNTGSSFASACASRKRPIGASFSAAKTEHVTYKRRPPGASNGHSLSSRLDCSCASASMSLARRNSLISGWRRMTPLAEQGASRRMASNTTLSHHSSGFDASAAIRVAWNPSLSRFAATTLSLVGSLSMQVRSSCSPASSSKWQLLPPGAAQASRTRSFAPLARPPVSHGAASWAAASCTDTWPSAKPGSASTGWGSARRIACGAPSIKLLSIPWSSRRAI